MPQPPVVARQPDRFDPDVVRSALGDGERLALLRVLREEGTGTAGVLDRWTQLASRTLRTAVCLAVLVDDERQHFVSRVGCGIEGTALTHSFCQYVVSGDAPLIVDDVASHPVLASNPAVSELGIAAYAGAPLRVYGQVLGAVCAIDPVARTWSSDDLLLLDDVAQAVSAELRLQVQENSLDRARSVVAARNRAHELIAADGPMAEVLAAVVEGLTGVDPTVRGSVLVCEGGVFRVVAGEELPLGYGVTAEGVVAGRGTHDCWSAPVLDRGGAVLGTVAVFGGGPGEVREYVRGAARDGARLAGIALERRRAQERLAHEATHDPLTGLCNRNGLTQEMGIVLDAARRASRGVTVLFVDLDRLKLVNDGLGHEAGDEVLTHVAERLGGAMRAGDVVARFGGDEFVVVPQRSLDCERTEQTARRLLREIEHPVVLSSGETVTVSASIGSVTIDPAAVTVAEALRRADIAMYEVKRAGGRGYRSYVRAGNAPSTRRLVLERELRSALDQHELDVLFQPIVDLRTGETEGVEALLRWDSRRLGPVSPGEFVPVAEEIGVIGGIGEWVLRQACRQIASRPNLRLNVNVSARQLMDPGLPDVVASILRATDVARDRLALEITETALLRADATTTATLAALEQLGVELVLDDFGTGYSSLATLKEHPVHALKIDRMFVAGLGADSGDAAIVEAVIGMAHGMGRPVTAEGVEHQGHLEILRGLCCDRAQGYLIGRPGRLSDVRA
ncbi:MAG: EAL domain-containing protein [Solirubrobacteraceae bacterium]|nr:EAL domain-containing protein [Solirubrobacteraceae bacterium]